MFGSKKKQSKVKVDPWSLDRPLLHLSRDDAWTVRDACAGTLIFGATGSGKTTGSGQSVAMAMLRAGFGGLVLTVKSEETVRWMEYMERCGWLDDLIVFSPESEYRFNFLEYERQRTTRGGGNTENLVELFVTVMSVGRKKASSGSDGAFWEQAMRQLLRNMLDALRLAGRPMTLDNMRMLIVSAPQSREEADCEDWKRDSFLFDTLATAAEQVEGDEDRHVLKQTEGYWLDEYAEILDAKTRGNIISTFTTTADGFMRGKLHTLFGTELNITPELTMTEGKVIVIDLPERQFHDLGKVAQLVWKTCWQRAVEQAERDASSRPVMLWVDEAQNFITSKETAFVQTVREKKGCCVYLTQSKSNYLDALGPGHDATAESFLGIPATKIFHCNGDPETNHWAERVISDDWTMKANQNVTRGDKSQPQGKGREDKFSTGYTRERQANVFASEFGKLRCGGPPEYTVDAILFQSGRQFVGGNGSSIRVAFPQKPTLK